MATSNARRVNCGRGMGLFLSEYLYRGRRGDDCRPSRDNIAPNANLDVVVSRSGHLAHFDIKFIGSPSNVFGEVDEALFLDYPTQSDLDGECRRMAAEDEHASVGCKGLAHNRRASLDKG